MWQEFFVAVMMRLYMSEEEFKFILPELENDKYEVISRFLFGLCNDETLDGLLDHVEVKELNTELDRKNCRAMLKQFVLDKLKEDVRMDKTDFENYALEEGSYILPNFPDSEKECVDEDRNFDDGSYYNTNLSKLMWVHEMQDINFAMQAAACLKNSLCIATNIIIPSDIPCINYILRARRSALNLKIQPSGFIGKCSKYFYEELHKTLDQNPNIKVS